LQSNKNWSQDKSLRVRQRCQKSSEGHVVIKASPSTLNRWPCTGNLVINQIQWIHRETTGTLKQSTALRAMEEPWNSLINKVKTFDWSKWVAISNLPPTCSFSCMGGVEKKLVTNTSRPESLSQTNWLTD